MFSLLNFNLPIFSGKTVKVRLVVLILTPNHFSFDIAIKLHSSSFITNPDRSFMNIFHTCILICLRMTKNYDWKWMACHYGKVQRKTLITNVNFSPRYISPRMVFYNISGQNTKIKKLIFQIPDRGLMHDGTQNWRKRNCFLIFLLVKNAEKLCKD